MNCSDAGYSGELVITSKSHKQAPLTWRSTHASSAPPVCGLSCCLVEQLEVVTEQLPWLLPSTSLKQIKYEKDMKMYRADVKEFFMSDTPSVVRDCTVERFKGHPKEKVIKEVLPWFLREQYVCLSEESPQLWKVTKGSGMGLKRSSYIADLAFATFGDR